VAHNHFKDLFSEEEEVNPKFVVAMLQGIPRLVRDEENKELGKEINEDEVIDAIGSLDLDKARLGRKHGLSQMEGVDHIISKEERAYFSFMHEVGIRRDPIPNDMIH
jgi:hypothetical protein